MISARTLLLIATIALLGSFSFAHAQYYDDFGGFGGFDGGFGGWNSGFDSFGGFGGFNDPCGFGGCGVTSYGSYGGSYGYSGYSGGCGFGGCGGGFSFTPFIPYTQPSYNSSVFAPSTSSIYSPTSVFSPTTISSDSHNIVTTTINAPTTGSSSYSQPYPIYIPQPVYTPPPVYYPPPVYTLPPTYQQPIVCSAQFSNFSPPSVAASWQLYSYRVTAISNIGGQMSYRLLTAPDGMGINSVTGQITWTPGTNQARTTPYQVTVAAYNGNCETTQTFYVTVRNQQVVYTPPPVVVAYVTPQPKPKPQPTCCVCPCPAPKPEPIVCPPTQIMPNTGVGADPIAEEGISVTSTMLVSTASAFWGGLRALFASPFTLFLVILILAILLVRAHRRMRAVEIAI